jgi:VCBS repeat-containing protein
LVRAVDSAGNFDPSPISYNWTIDTTPPDTSLTSTPPDPDDDNTPTFYFSGSDSRSGVDSFQCRVDGDGWSACSSPHTTATLGDGVHTFDVRAVDNAGNMDPSPASRTWQIDTVPPDTALTSTPPDPDNDSTPTFTFEGSDAGGSGVDSFLCQMDGTAWSGCSSPYTTPGLSEGIHTIAVRSVDKAGNSDPTPVSYTWKIDTSPPDTNITSAPPDPDSNKTPTFSFASDDGAASFECRVDVGSWSTCVSPHTAPTLADGNHTFAVRAVDSAGNIDPSPASHTWTIDTVPPDTILTSTPPDPDDDNTPTFSFIGSDGAVGFECQVDGGNWSNCPSPHTTATLSDGEHTFAVRALDSAGNADASPASHSWTIDATPPDTTLDSAPADPDNDNTPTFTFSGSDPGVRAVVAFQCQVDGGGWSNCSSPYTTPGLSDGEHTFAVRSVDAAGNVDPSPASHAWAIDTDPPDTTFTSTPPDPDSDNTPSFGFTSGDGMAGFECQVDGDSWSACSSPHTTATLGDGVHTFDVRAVDDGGNRDPSPASYTWLVDATPPEAGDDSGTSYTTDEETPFTTGNVLENDGDPGDRPIDLIGYDDSALAGTLTDNGDGTFDYDPNSQFEYLAVGVQAHDVFTYTIADAVGLTDSAEVIISVTGVNDAPSISDLPDQLTLAGVPVGPMSFTVDDVDTAAHDLHLSFLTSDPEIVDPLSGVTFGGIGTIRSLVVTPTQGIVGTVAVTVTVSDGDLEASDVFLLQVEPWRVYLPIVFR